MAEFEWQPDDVRDLVRRDLVRSSQLNGVFPIATALLSLWLRKSWPIAAAVLLGMCIAWTLSLLSGLRSLTGRWQAYVKAQFRPLRVSLRDEGVTWEGPHGSRVLRWEGLSVRRVGTTWVLLVGGQELAYLPARVLTSEEAERLAARVERPAQGRT
jgi:hypothetical protein